MILSTVEIVLRTGTKHAINWFSKNSNLCFFYKKLRSKETKPKFIEIYETCISRNNEVKL